LLSALELSKTYANRPALAPLNLEVAPGEVYCLLGPNGAGKTTLLSLFLGFIQPSSGVALVAGEEVARDPIAARRRIGYVPEQVQLYPELTGEENLGYFASLAGVQHAAGELANLLVSAGLPREALSRPASSYSKGMRQKVALALSRAKQASVLLLDEPTSGLDPGAASELCASVRAERARGAAVLMVTHDLSAAAAVACRIGVLRAGRLVCSASAGLSEAELVGLYRQAINPAPALREEASLA
jgi:ABC-2 type transport system ATP-binding protein